MQIGTLIATTQKYDDGETPFQIETHSYPVVTYLSKENAVRNKHLGESYFMEGSVWNRVELRDVITICLSDSHLPWQEFIDFLWIDIWRNGSIVPPFIHALHKLGELGVKIDPMPEGIHTLHIQTYCCDEGPVMVRTGRDDTFAINVEYSENTELMAGKIREQISMYAMSYTLLMLNEPMPKWQVKFVTDEPDLELLVKKININLIYHMGGYEIPDPYIHNDGLDKA